MGPGLNRDLLRSKPESGTSLETGQNQRSPLEQAQSSDLRRNRYKGMTAKGAGLKQSPHWDQAQARDIGGNRYEPEPPSEKAQGSNFCQNRPGPALFTRSGPSKQATSAGAGTKERLQGIRPETETTQVLGPR